MHKNIELRATAPRILWLLRGQKELRDFRLSSISSSIFFKTNVVVNFLDQQIILDDGKIELSRVNFLKISEKIADFIAYTRLWKYRDRSIACYIRAVNSFSLPWERPLFNGAEHMGALKKNWLLAFFVRFSAFSLPFYFLRFIFILVTFMESLRNRKYLRNYKIIVLYYGGYLGGYFDLLVESIQLSGSKTFVIQSNWDNLSSKNYFSSEPDYFGVWGEQSKHHLLTIQRKPNIPVILLGNPRKVNIGSKANTNPKILSGTGKLKKLSNSVILAGHGEGVFDLNLLRTIIKIRKEINLHFDLIYKPHPFARSSIIDQAFHLEFDNELILVEEEDLENNKLFFNFFNDASVLVSQMSTLCIESLAIGTPVIIPTFSAYRGAFNFEQAVNSLPHFVGVTLISGVSLARHETDLRNHIIKSIMNRISPGSVEWFCSDVTFSDEIVVALQEILDTEICN